jgi:hypothetical protein
VLGVRKLGTKEKISKKAFSPSGLSKSSALEWLDAFGVFLSGLCVLHCLLLPFSILTLPILIRYYLFHPWAHFFLGSVILLVAALALSYGYFKHRKIWVLFLALLGLALWALGTFAFGGQYGDFDDYQMRLVLLIMGGVLIAVSHLLNTSFLRSYRLR